RVRVARLDARISSAIRSLTLPFSDVLSAATQWLFSAQVAIPLFAVAVVTLWLSGRQPLAASLARFLPAVAVGLVLKAALRLPAPETALVNTHTARIGCNALECGFPSGHVLRATFLLLWLALVVVPATGRLVGCIAASLLILGVAWTRIYSGDHFVL